MKRSDRDSRPSRGDPQRTGRCLGVDACGPTRQRAGVGECTATVTEIDGRGRRDSPEQATPAVARRRRSRDDARGELWRARVPASEGAITPARRDSGSCDEVAGKVPCARPGAARTPACGSAGGVRRRDTTGWRRGSMLARTGCSDPVGGAHRRLHDLPGAGRRVLLAEPARQGPRRAGLLDLRSTTRASTPPTCTAPSTTPRSAAAPGW